MNTKPMSQDEKLAHNLVGLALLILGAPIASLGAYGIYFAITKPYDAAPGLGPAALIVMLIGGVAIALAVSLLREARNRPTRPY